MKTLAALLASLLLVPLAAYAQTDSLLNGWKFNRFIGSYPASASMRQVTDTATEGRYSQSFTASVSNSEIVEFEKDFGRDIITPHGFQIDGYTKSLSPSDPSYLIGVQLFLVNGDSAYQIRGFAAQQFLVNQWVAGGFYCRVKWYTGIGEPPKTFRKMRIQFRLFDTTLSNQATVDEILDNLQAVYMKLDSAGYAISVDSSIVIDRFGDPDPTPVIPKPNLSIFQKAIDFGTVPINKPVAYKDTAIVLRNMGDETLRGIISVVGNGFSMEDTVLTIPPMDSTAKTVRFSPAIIGKLTGLLIIHSNDPTSPDTVQLSGLGDRTDGVNDNPLLPKVFSLSQNYPNPFNPSTTIEFEVPKQNFVNISVFNILGQEVKILVNEMKSAGNYKVSFDASNLPSGTYLYRMQCGSFIKTSKMVLMK